MQTTLHARSKASAYWAYDSSVNYKRRHTPQASKQNDVFLNTTTKNSALRGKLHVTQTARTLGFVCVLFFLPLLLSGPQLLVWSLVNLALIAAVRKLSRSKARWFAFVPSIAAVLHGVIFWPFTIFLVYMMPAVWLGNLALMYIVSRVSQKWLGILIWWLVKSWLLFLIAFILIQNSFLPTIFLKAMGIFQLATVLIGGYVLFGIRKLAQ
jgi:hypothetical protein